MDKVMKGMRGRFSEARSRCPGMSEEVYQLSDYLAMHINEELVPSGIVIALMCTMDDIKKGRCGFCGHSGSSPEYLVEHKSQVLAQACYILQVIDAVTDVEFADAVRIECKNAFNWQVPKLVIASDDLEKKYPAYVKAAVDWWSDAIQHPKMDNGDDSLGMLMAMLGGSAFAKDLSDDEMRAFRSTLANEIESQIDEYGLAQLNVDYGPNRILSKAGQAAGITSQFTFPCKTSMSVSKSKVIVSAGYGAPNKIIWESL